jgi:ACS family hexuronate transporter-like MFS transporter
MSTLTQKTGNYRWTICALVFFATTVNYLDRTVISYVKPDMARDFGWDAAAEAANYANIEMIFKLSYALGMLFAGRVVDKLGTKMGYLWATLLWSLSAIGHAFANSALGFGIARAFLGVTEAGNFPAAIKSTAEWFPKRERALATGIFNSGTNVGAILVPLTVPIIAATWGWKAAFIITGSLGFVWLVLWWIYYETPQRHKRLSAAELDHIVNDPDRVEAAPQEKVSWFKLLQFRQTWAFAVGKFLTDPVWWFYLFWLPDFLRKEYHLTTPEQIMWPSAIVYIIASFGSVGGGWLPLRLVNRGWPVFRARKTSMLIYALCVMPIVFAQVLGSMNMWLAVLVIGIAASAHQAWSANIFTTVSDMFPTKTTASVTGIGGMFGGMGGILLTLLVQKRRFVYYESIGQIQTGYYIMFFICGSAYLLGWTVMHFLVPRMQPVKI